MGFESCLACSDDIKIARRIEKFIKNQRSRKLIEQLIDPIFNPTGVLAQLVRVPELGINQRVRSSSLR